MEKALGWVVAALALLGLGCIYDSNWGQAKTSQQNAAQHYSGAELGEEKAPTHRLPPKKRDLRRMRLTAYATPEHAAQVVNWQARFIESVARANQLLGPVLGIEIEPVDGGFWRPQADPDNLTALLGELEVAHAAADTEFVIGLIGSLPRLEASFHQLGVGRLHGNHMVLRAANDALEYDAIEKSYTELGADQRAELYRSRRAHQASAVLIHELGHCLGAVHVRTVNDLMHAMYGSEMSALDDPVAEVMRITLDERFKSKELRSARQMVEQIEHQLERGRELWIPDEEKAMRAYLSQLAQAGMTSSAPPNVSVPPVAGLTDAEQELYRRVLEHKARGQLSEASVMGQPLFRDHSDLHPIADLRCQLAMALGGDWEQTRKECAPLLGQNSRF